MMNNASLIKAIETFATPTFLFDADELKKRVSDIREILDKETEIMDRRINLCYSIKANPFLIPYLSDVVDMFEVCSPGELEIIKSYGISGSRIIYSGVNKGLRDTREAVNCKSAVVTAESLRHIELIKEAAKDSKDTVHVILRMTSGNQFGMSLEDIKSILQKGPYDNISIDGIHYFAGTQRNNPKPQEKELNKIKSVMEELREEFKMELPKLEYGPGLSYPYFDNEDFSDTLSPLKNVVPLLADMTETADITIEMGRFIASSCGYYLTGIADLKKSNNQNWCIIDGGLNHVNYYGQMMGMKRPVIRHFNKNLEQSHAGDASESYALCGSLCTSNDILVREMPLDNPQIGDVLVFEHIGAYSVTEGVNLFLSRDMAKITVHEKGNFYLLRDTLNSWKINCKVQN